MDIAVNLIETYLRLTGYLTLSEVGIVQRLGEGGEFRAITDVDVVAVRMPGSRYAAEPRESQR